MAEEKKLSFKTAEELATYLLDLEGQMVNMQETIDKLAPVDEKTEEETEDKKEELSDDEVSEIDRLLQDS